MENELCAVSRWPVEKNAAAQHWSEVGARCARDSWNVKREAERHKATFVFTTGAVGTK